MHYEVRFTTNQGGYYYPRVRFETHGEAEKWASEQVEDSPHRLDSYEVRETLDYGDLQQSDGISVKQLALTALCLIVLAVATWNQLAF